MQGRMGLCISSRCYRCCKPSSSRGPRFATPPSGKPWRLRRNDRHPVRRARQQFPPSQSPTAMSRMPGYPGEFALSSPRNSVSFLASGASCAAAFPTGWKVRSCKTPTRPETPASLPCACFILKDGITPAAHDAHCGSLRRTPAPREARPGKPARARHSQ